MIPDKRAEAIPWEEPHALNKGVESPPHLVFKTQLKIQYYLSFDG